MSEAGLHVDERRLAAILAADVAGYSRLMGRNEEETVRDLEAHQAVILPLIAKHGGAVINIAGDGIVAQFPSAVRAVECAVAMQKTMAERNFDVPADRRMLLRIGVNLGDIIHDGTRTYGDGINVAARLEPLAEPGGICISAPVREAIFGKLGLPLRDIGEKSLKNIARPVHIYQIQPPDAPARRDWLNGALRQYRRLAPALGLVVLLAALAGVGAWRFWPRQTLTPDYTPLIAVLPFASIGGDSSLDTLGPSFTREVSATLATFPQLRLVSAAGLPAQKLANPKQAAQDMGADYALEGDLLKTGDKLRVRAQLTDAADGETVWSDSHEFEWDNPVAIQERAAVRISGALGGVNGRLLKIEQAASWRKPESALTEYDYHLRAMTYSMKFTFDDNLQARKIAEEGLARFPNSALLKTRLAWSYLLESDALGPYENCHETIEIAFKLGREAVDAKNKSRFVIYQLKKFMGHAYAWHGGDFQHSVQELTAAVEMAPYDPEIRASSAFWLANAGQFDKAIEYVSWAIAHDFQDYVWVKTNSAWTYYLAGRYEEALQALKGVEATEAWPVLVIYVRLGRLDEAREAAAQWLKTGPHSVLAESCAPIREPMKQKYLDDLRKAGVPERTSQ
ncbi:MAG TPA: adenylate/guanylate cyclase domain-containing protein [Roseiarcus sp.]|jgi:class 3 adenylate cyclase/TolB-like protein|nr:adenylate/guanylate cyclase domain-containing protein [Roseiarcus sp.]